MTATIELNERLVKKAKKLTGIEEDSKMVNYVLDNFIKAEQFKEMLVLHNSGTWDGSDRREDK